MKNIIELPTGEILQVTEDQHRQLINRGLVIWVSDYMGSHVNGYCYYLFYREEIMDYLDRGGINNFNNFLTKRFREKR